MLSLKFVVRCFCTKSNTPKMVRILNVAEKNDAAKSVSEIMSGGRYRKREGISRFNKIYEFEYNILNQNCTMSMTSVSGHLLEFRFIGQYTKWHGCSPAALFEAPMEKYCPQNFMDIKRTLEREVRGCQSLIIWTDGDREGENIGYEIIRVCQAVKANLRIYRARFSEITPQAIARAVRSLEQPNINVSDAVDVRQELDLRIGAAFTRFQTLRLQKVFPDVLAEQLISYGSCQFPTLGFVVERYKQVQAFIAEQFWKITATVETEDGVAEFHWKRQRLFDHTACLVLYLHCLEDPTARVVDVRSRPKSKWRPVALDTVELEKLASRKLRINAKETMKIAEKLYTQGCISYPRTETNMFPAEFDLRNLIQQQTQDPQWGGFAAGLLEAGPRPRNGNKTDHAHPPIHPTKYVGTLQGNEKRVYEFVVRHFLACCSQDAQGHETTIEIDINGEQFTVQGLMIIARNYLDVYPYDRWNAKVIPTMEVGATFQPKSVEMTEGETSPPSLLTEADLISLMDKHGIGTDATHAEHIEKIKSRMYVGLTPDGKFLPGELGMGLVDGYDAMGFEMSKPHLRAELEADLKRICDGTKDKNEVLQAQVVKYRDVFMEVIRQATKIDTALAEYFGNAHQVNENVEETLAPSVVRPCPNCGSDMLLKTKKDGRGWFLSCMGYPECRAAIWFPDFVLRASVDDAVCDVCQPHPTHKMKFQFKKGSVPPYIPLEYVGCIGGCDGTLVELFDLHKTTRRNPQTTAGNQQKQTGATRNRGTSNSSNPGNSGVPRNSGYGNSGNPGNGGYGNSGTPRDSGYSGSGRSGSTQFNSMNYSQPHAPLAPRNTNIQTGWNGSKNASVTSMTRHDSTATSDVSSVGDGNTVVCQCGEDARLLTVRKEGPNTGRQFYTCARPQESRCGFFLWADDGGNAGASGDGPGPREAPGTLGQAQLGGRGTGFRGSDTSGRSSSSVFDDNTVSCGCGIDARLLTVHKEGPNTGRQFYACSKPRGEGCSFFQWADETTPNTRGGDTGFPARRGRGPGGVKRNASGEKDGKVTKKRKCGLCGEEGHTRTRCPHKT